MRKISRLRRAQIKRDAEQVYQQGQLAGWSAARIAAAILRDLPDIRPLEAWRLAHGWSRPQVIESIAAIYRQAGLVVPAISSSMLCRWEHGQIKPGTEYGQVLSRLYNTYPDQLGLCTRAPVFAMPGGNLSKGLQAVRESIQLAMEVDGAGGGPFSRGQVDQAVQYYALNYARFPPGLLAAEVHHCRAVVTTMLGHRQQTAARVELRRLGGWLSALLGNLTFHLSDYTAANIHLSIAAKLGADVDHRRLTAWAFGARSMLARYQNCYTEALDLGREAVKYADTPLRRAQAIAWAELPALAHLDRRREALDAISAAQRQMEAAPDRDQAGRFGFDLAELELHLAEAQLVLGDAAAAAVHAQTSRSLSTAGRPGWAAATLIFAHSEARRRRPDQSAELALHVLDTIPPALLRETSRQRLALLDQHLLTEFGRPCTVAVDLHERLRVLPPLCP